MVMEDVDLEVVRQSLKDLPEVANAEINEGAVEVYPKSKQSIEALVLQVCRENEWHISHFEKTPVGLDEVFWELTA